MQMFEARLTLLGLEESTLKDDENIRRLRNKLAVLQGVRHELQEELLVLNAQWQKAHGRRPADDEESHLDLRIDGAADRAAEPEE